MPKARSNSNQKIDSFLKRNVMYNSAVHLMIGIGIGIALTHPFFDPHPVKWAGIFLLIGLLGHLYPLTKH